MTLVEVLVAAVILGVGVAGLVSAASLAMRNGTRFEQRSVALGLAQQKLAEIDLLGPEGWLASRPSQGREERNGLAFSWTTRVEQESAQAPFEVTVRVSWQGAVGEDSVEIQTLMSGYTAIEGTQPPGGDYGGTVAPPQ